MALQGRKEVFVSVSATDAALTQALAFSSIIDKKKTFHCFSNFAHEPVSVFVHDAIEIGLKLKKTSLLASARRRFAQRNREVLSAHRSALTIRA